YHTIPALKGEAFEIVIACINLFHRYLRCGGLGVPLNAPKGDAIPRPMQGKKYEAMKTTYINLYKS
ncbi:MAG: hypothetical protein QXJ51_05290, partial [Sulfolobales archaeon]